MVPMLGPLPTLLAALIIHKTAYSACLFSLNCQKHYITGI
uniref:Uncharacterized protein n=1 Tax=Anguilla anguilla TaxID=7936 RepID=A0A0E9VG39_ANGAN